LTLVLDNSVALAWCFEDEQTPAIMDLLDRVAESGASAPLLWPLEAMNGLFVAERRRRIDQRKRTTLAAFLRDLPIRLDTETAEKAWEATSRVAEQHKLTAYDAAYLELALRRKLPLASVDRDLCRAAAVMGVQVLGAA
jgi:predicted nucleic acid-binding protein